MPAQSRPVHILQDGGGGCEYVMLADKLLSMEVPEDHLARPQEYLHRPSRRPRSCWIRCLHYVPSDCSTGEGAEATRIVNRP
jgi:hypothetical protein